eukprot:UN07897
MPFVKNKDLKKWLQKRDGETTERDYINIALGMSRGIDHLHSHNVIHRDIALRNFLVGDDDRIMASDFGLSRALAP